MKHLLLWKGRAGRLEYLLVLIIIFVLNVIITKMTSGYSWDPNVRATGGQIFVALFAVGIELIMVWLKYMVMCRRFHDLNLSAWLLVVVIVGSFGLVIISKGLVPAWAALNVLPWLLLFWPGDKGPNNYGEPILLGDLFIKQTANQSVAPKQKIKTKEDGRIDFHL